MTLKLFKHLLIFILMFSALFASSSYAIPREIILIRHADKLDQAQPGPFLSELGQARADMFKRYYMDKVNKGLFPIPNYIITTKPTYASNREQFTVAPLVSELISQNLIKQSSLLLNTYSHGDGLPELAKDLLKSSTFNNQVILICWHHGEIPKLLDKLGAVPLQPKLADDEYDTVYDIKFNVNGTSTMNVLRGQYPVVTTTDSNSSTGAIQQ